MLEDWFLYKWANKNLYALYVLRGKAVLVNDADKAI